MFGVNTESRQLVIPTSMTPIWPISTAARPKVEVEITLLIVCNRTAGSVNLRLCRDFDGGGTPTLDATTALWWDKAIAANDTLIFQAQGPGTGIPIGKEGVIGVQASASDALTLTLVTVSAKVNYNE